MGKYWYYFLFLVWLSYLIVGSILLFANGFLLNRIEIDKNSTCVPQFNNECPAEGCINQKELQDIPVCLPQRSRVVLIIIDAFRYDFALYNEELQYPLPYENKIPIINNIVTNNPQNGRLYKFIADPPTTTLQRLKALTTGSLPTFIDAGSNFASSKITEDNILSQLVANNKTVVFLGDDTWINIYPNLFVRKYPYPSFNVWDLDTVDIGITNSIYNELQKDDWNLLIGHYLGVDHCGHRYGPNHSEMARKLQEMNDVIKNIIANLDDNTMLFVIGDHGMTATGDHGGESIDEVTAALFIYSKIPLIDQDQDSVKQIDLIPTLATILGIPIPYANLGTVILSCLPLRNFETTTWAEIAEIVWTNVQQMTLYINDYSAMTSIFDAENMERLKIEYNTLKNQFIRKNIDNKIFIKNSKNYMTSLRKMCEEVWVQFDSFSMTRGLLLCFITVFFVYIFVNNIASAKLSNILSRSFILLLYGSLFVIFSISAIGCYLNFISNYLSTSFLISGITSIFILAFVLIQNWDLIAINWHEINKTRNWVDIACRFIFLASVCTFLSNSFVVHECYVSLFLLITLISIKIIDLFSSASMKISKNVKNNFKSSVKVKLFSLVIIFCILIRLSMYFWQCREEQNCSESFSQKQNNASRVQLIFTLVSVGLAISSSRMLLKYTGNLAAFSITVLFAQYAPTVIAVCCGGFWVLHNFPIENKSKAFVQADSLAFIAYFLIICGLIITYLKPLTTFTISKNVNSQSFDTRRTVPQLFHEIKKIFYEKAEKKEETPIICGLGTAYSATYIIVAIYILLLFTLLLGNAIASSAIILFFSIAVVLSVLSIVRYEKASNINKLLEVPAISLLIWIFLTIYFFYGTGHQPTFPNIIWEAAFVGTGGNFTNNYIPAALILINTFGSYIMMGLLLPLLQIAPFSIYAIISSSNKKTTEQKDLTKGDVILFENNHILLLNTFKLSCNYLSCFAIRVFATMLSATIHCRHLMVWKIFAPKFIFEVISMIVTVPSVLLGYLLLIRITSAIDELVKTLDKKR